MSKSQTLRALVTERLTAAAEDIFALVERTIAEYEKELCRSKEENQRKQQLLDEVLSPQLLLHRTDVQGHWLSPEPRVNQKIPETPQIKEEPKEQRIKQEEEQLPQITAVCVKSEEQRQPEETQVEECGAAGHICSGPHGHFHSETEEQTDSSSDEDWEPPASTSTAQMETEADGDNYSQVQIKDTSSYAHNSTLFTKYKSAPETSATVTDGHMSGTDEGGGEHECSDCKKRFATRSGLLTHSRVHTNVKPFSCLVCEKAFTYESNYYVHMRLHAGEKPYGCSICKKAFTLCSALNKHMASHTGVKLYSCLICKKAFSRKDYCDLHMRLHKGENPFCCSICERTFISGRPTDHMTTHYGSGRTMQLREKRILSRFYFETVAVDY